MYAKWYHDVLIIHKGPSLNQLVPITVRDMVEPVKSCVTKDIKGMGDDPKIFTFQLDNESVIQVLVPSEQASIAEGPFISK